MAGKKHSANTITTISRERAKPQALPERPANLPYGRWLGDFSTLSKAEKKLVSDCAAGKWCDLQKGMPDKPTSTNRIRASIIRFLLLGGDDQHPLHEAGVQISGGWIEGDLDLSTVRAKGRLYFLDCHVDNIIARDAWFPGLMLRGSYVTSLSADRMRVVGNVFLDRGFRSNGEVRLLGSQIGGNLECANSSFGNIGEDGLPQADALSADGASVKGDVFFHNGFNVVGEVRLLGMEIGGDLDCSGGTFRNAGEDGISVGNAISADGAVVKGGVFLNQGFNAIGEVRLIGMKIGGSLYCRGGNFNNNRKNGRSTALDADRLEVAGWLFLRGGKFLGGIDLTSAYVSSIIDDPDCWNTGEITLDGFRYDRITGGSTSSDNRISWLKSQIPDDLNKSFKPQPWEQAIKVLRDMGHPLEARRVAIEKQRVWRKSWQREMRTPLGFLHRLPRWLVHKAYGGLAGYGYRPWRTVGLMFTVCCLCSLAYYAGRYDGLFGPTSPPIELSKDLAAAGCGDGGTPGKVYWTSPECPMPPEYTSFQPFIYSLDVLLPFVNLQQENDWAPIVSNERGQPLIAGHLLRFLMWFEVLFGWLSSVLLAAVAGNLVKKD